MWNAVSKTPTFGTPLKIFPQASTPPRFAGMWRGPNLTSFLAFAMFALFMSAESVKTSPPCRMRWPIASIWSFSPSARPRRPRPELSPVGGRAFSRSFTTCLRASPWSLGPPQPMRSTRPFASRVSVFMSKSWYLSDELPELTTNTFLICFFIFTA